VTHRISNGAASLLLAAVVVTRISAVPAVAAPPDHRRLPPEVFSQAPGMHPLGKGRHSWWGVPMYEATLWTAGPRWSAAEPHALDLEPSRTVPADALVKTAIDEMRHLKVGNERQLKVWQAEMKKVIPSVRAGDQVVIFCSSADRTLFYFNDSGNGEVDDQSFCPALMSVWLHPQTKHQALRRSLLGSK
jgi:hypothetical protein